MPRPRPASGIAASQVNLFVKDITTKIGSICYWSSTLKQVATMPSHPETAQTNIYTDRNTTPSGNSMHTDGTKFPENKHGQTVQKDL